MSVGVRPGLPGLRTGEHLDRLASLAGRVLHAPVAFVTRVGEETTVGEASAGARTLASEVESRGASVAWPDGGAEPKMAGKAPAAFAGVPLRYDGGVVGSLCVADDEPRSWSEGDREALAELAQVAQALLRLDRLAEGDDARSELERTAARLACLQLVTSRLADAGSVAEVVAAVAEEAAACLGFSSLELSVTDRRGQATTTVCRPGQRRLVVDDSGRETAVAARAGLAAQARASGEAAFVEAGGAHGAGALACVPLGKLAQGTGCLTLVWPDGRAFHRGDQRFLGALADQCVLALERIRVRQVEDRATSLYRARAAEAQILQRSLLPPATPTIPGLDLACCYRPAEGTSQVGGDFYDVFPLRDGLWGAVIGDVSGKGVAAASLTAMARYAVRAAALEHESPRQALEVLNQTILDADVGERFCTVALAVVRPGPDATEVRLALGGHPHPLLVEQDGAVTPVGRPGTAMGLFADPDLTDVGLRLSPGAALVLYTDGVLEARSPEGAWGDRLLEQALAGAAGRDADALASAVDEAVLAFEGGRPRDDMGLLVLRVPVPGESLGAPLRVRLPAEARASGLARRSARDWLAPQRLSEHRYDDVVLVISELVTNAARAARSRVELRLYRTSGSVLVEVSDDGDGFAPPPAVTAPPAEAEVGRGLFLVQMLADRCEFVPGPWGTLARCRFYVGPGA